MNIGNVINVRNVNEALPRALDMLQLHGVPAVSRDMHTLRVPGPVLTVYERPTERVLFDPWRDANPFFHLFEAMWILSGSNSVDLPKRFLNSIDQFSDNGITFHGAYGYRLKAAFGFDQIEAAIFALRKTPDSRQVVLSIWDPRRDMNAHTKDMPCNDMVMLDLVDGALNMTVCNRSNDAIWGAYGANAVQFSILQEYITLSLGVQVGHYVQMSNNFHVYTDNPFWLQYREGNYEHGHVHNPYTLGQVSTLPLAASELDAALLARDCFRMNIAAEKGFDLVNTSFDSSFGGMVLEPAIRGYDLYKLKQYDEAMALLQEYVVADDWCKAMVEWVQRRKDRAAAKGVFA